MGGLTRVAQRSFWQVPVATASTPFATPTRAPLDDPRFDVVLAAPEETGAFLFVQPWQVAAADRLRDFYLTNVLGNPFETTIAIARQVG